MNEMTKLAFSCVLLGINNCEFWKLVNILQIHVHNSLITTGQYIHVHIHSIMCRFTDNWDDKNE